MFFNQEIIMDGTMFLYFTWITGISLVASKIFHILEEKKKQERVKVWIEKRPPSSW